MHHHFASRGALVVGLIEHVFYRRMKHFLDEFMAELKKHQDANEPVSPEVMAVELHWNSMQTKEFSAYLRLAVAARNDPELQKAFHPAARRFDEVWKEEMAHAFPQWEDRVELMQLASDITQSAHIGLLVHGFAIDEHRMKRIQDELRRIVHGLSLRKS